MVFPPLPLENLLQIRQHESQTPTFLPPTLKHGRAFSPLRMTGRSSPAPHIFSFYLSRTASLDISLPIAGITLFPLASFYHEGAPQSRSLDSRCVSCPTVFPQPYLRALYPYARRPLLRPLRPPDIPPWFSSRSLFFRCRLLSPDGLHVFLHCFPEEERPPFLPLSPRVLYSGFCG